MKPESTVPASHVEKSGPHTPDPYTETGTGGLKAQGSAQAIELLPRDDQNGDALEGDLIEQEPHADLLDAVRSVHRSCDCDDCLGEIAAAVLEAAAASLRRLGHTAAADRLASTARDLTEGATS
jgi:hypothetical protein